MLKQQTLPFRADEGFLRDYLERATGKTVFLLITDNSSSVLSVTARGGALSVRLHWMFLEAGDEVLREMAGFIRLRRGSTPLLNEFVRRNMGRMKEGTPRRTRLRTAGRRHDLMEIFLSLNREYFGGRLSSLITWGARGPRRAVRKRTLGSYCGSTDTIRINPVLDSGKVPRYYVEFVLYHEMLHADVGMEKGRVHSREFRRRERLFRHYERAIAFEGRG
jgi:predicted SprT family Zn-dependent metalloprotease